MFYDPKHKFGAPEHFYFAEKRDIRGFSFARQWDHHGAKIIPKQYTGCFMNNVTNSKRNISGNNACISTKKLHGITLRS